MPDKSWFDATKFVPGGWARKPVDVPALPAPPPALNGYRVPEVAVVPVSTPVASPQPDDEGAPLNLAPPVPPPAVPGLVGALIDLVWQSASFQIAEVAVGAALAMMALLTARSYRYGSLGLNHYVLVLAKTSTGKSFGFKANDNLMLALDRHLAEIKPPHHTEAKARRQVLKGMVSGDIGSAQGLAQHMPDNPSALFQIDEFVEQIKVMASPRCPPHMAQLKAEMLKLTEMCGPDRTYRGAKYSKRSGKEEVADVVSPALSIFGVGVPTFYDDLNGPLLESGFIPRFTILDYEGTLPSPNPNPVTAIPDRVLEHVRWLFEKQYITALRLAEGEGEKCIQQVVASPEGKARLDWFDNVCMRKVVEAHENNQPYAGLWSRGKEHVKIIACYIAIGRNPALPTIEANDVDLAIGWVRPNLDKLTNKVASGEMGLGDDARAADVRKVLWKMYVRGGRNTITGLDRNLADDGIIQLGLVKTICATKASFFKHPLGINRAFEETIQAMSRYNEIQFHTVKTKDGKDRRGLFVTLNLDFFEPYARRHGI